MSKSRITYIDTLKGVCIILVVLMHCGLPVNDNSLAQHINDALRTYRMPTYYFLSGIFFKTYSGFNEFTRRKLNNIIIPLFFFYLLNVLACVICWLGIGLVTGFTSDFEWCAIFDIFYRIEWRLQAVAPLWFLFSLFWANLIFYILKSKFRDFVVCVIVLLLAIIGFYSEYHKAQLPWYITSSLIGLPYFVLGHYIKQFGWLNSVINRWFGFLQFFVIFILMVFIARDYTQDTVGGFLLYRYFIPFISILSLFLLCKSIPQRIPIVTFLGRYSLIVLGTHMFLISYLYLIPMRIFGEENQWLWKTCLFIIVIVLELIIVPFMRDKFPQFTAQKEFFNNSWRLSSEEKE